MQSDVMTSTGERKRGCKKPIKERKISAIKLKVASRVISFHCALSLFLFPFEINDANKFGVTMANRLISIQQPKSHRGEKEIGIEGKLVLSRRPWGK